MVAVVRRDTSKQSLIEARWKCIEFVSERFQFYLQAHDDRKGLIIADFPGSGKEEKKLLQDYYRLLEKGTKYVKPANIVMNLLTTETRRGNDMGRNQGRHLSAEVLPGREIHCVLERLLNLYQVIVYSVPHLVCSVIRRLS
jgi:hypothetical protein